MGEGLEQGMMRRSSSDHPQADKVPYRPRNVWKASVRREGEIITKEYSGAPFVPRLFGRISLSWEEAALRRRRRYPV